MNKQDVFNRVATHLLTQKAKSRITSKKNEYNFTCLYRGPNGLKCAIGALIADEHFEDYFNSFAASDPRVMKALYKSGVVDIQDMNDNSFSPQIFLGQLQAIHDNNPVENWKETLQDFANRHHLDASILSNFNS